MRPMEYRDERDLHIYTDGSSYPGRRRGGVGIVFVAVDGSGEERVEDYPVAGYAGATNQQMEIKACIEALLALVTRRAPIKIGNHRRIVVWSDSLYLVEGYDNARFSWPRTGWMNRDGNPVANAKMWKELVKVAGRTGRPVEFEMGQGPQDEHP